MHKYTHLAAIYAMVSVYHTNTLVSVPLGRVGILLRRTLLESTPARHESHARYLSTNGQLFSVLICVEWGRWMGWRLMSRINSAHNFMHTICIYSP